MHVHVYLCVVIITQVQMPTEIRGNGAPDDGAGN